MPKINEQEFKKLLSSDILGGLYMIYGEEKYYVKYYADKLCEKIAGKEPDEFSFHIFKDLSNLDEIASACDIIPFNADCNCVVLKDIDIDEAFKGLRTDSGSGKELLGKITEILKKANNETAIIISQPTVTPKAAGAQKKITEFCEKNGTVLYIPKKSESELIKIVLRMAKKRDCEISPNNAQSIIYRCGTDVNTLINECEKLFAYCKGREAEADDIELIITPNPEYNVFKVAESIIYENTDTAYKILDDMFTQKQPPENILGLISKAYCDMYRVRVAIQSGMRSTELAGKFDYTANKTFLLEKAEKNSKHISTDALRKMIDLLYEADRKIKNTSLDKRAVLETLIAELSEAKSIY
ncbi:MAG: DNA polymerase III subunit delta [Clostridiales bacterium]|nr:DNA polymerase III subunit delta [Clostridiales bacterium]